MSQFPPTPPDPLPHAPPPGAQRRFAPANRPRRPASVTISREHAPGAEGESLMDPATKSLSDALRITFRVVQLAVLALVVLYFLSGFRSVQEGERGIRLVLGRVVDDDIAPGFRFSWPEPFGELVKVRTGAQTFTIDDAFFPNLSDEEKRRMQVEGVQFLGQGGRDSLPPEADGSVITADGNIAHTRWSVTFSRAIPTQVEQNVSPDHERSLVEAAVKRGVVRACASVTIDELLKNAPDPDRRPGDFRGAEAVALDLAQRTLDEMRSGLHIDVLVLTAKIPPRRVISAFNEVQSSQSTGAKEKEEAFSERTAVLTETAGEAAPFILAQIERYEQSLELGQAQRSEEVLATIDALLAAHPVTIDGRTLNPRLYGKARTLLSQAEKDRSGAVNRAEAEAFVFDAKLRTYQTNPAVLLTGDWTDAFGEFLRRDTLQTLLLPPSAGRYVLLLSRDPELIREQERAYNLRKAEESARARETMRERQRYEAKIDPSTGRARN